MSPAERVDRIFAETVGSDLTSWERFNFLPSIRDKADLTSRQHNVLRTIEQRVLKEDSDD